MILIIGGAYQGKHEFAGTLGLEENKILYNAHEFIRDAMIKGKDAAAEFAAALDGVEAVTCDEIGMGIVPTDSFEREWRELTGRIMCDTAKKADTVYRVCCSVATKIKG